MQEIEHLIQTLRVQVEVASADAATASSAATSAASVAAAISASDAMDVDDDEGGRRRKRRRKGKRRARDEDEEDEDEEEDEDRNELTRRLDAVEEKVEEHMGNCPSEDDLIETIAETFRKHGIPGVLPPEFEQDYKQMRQELETTAGSKLDLLNRTEVAMDELGKLKEKQTQVGLDFFFLLLVPYSHLAILSILKN
jgi:hypothetical protein